MKIESAKITMLINVDYTEIEIHDADANTNLATIRLTPEQLSAILSRQGYVSCECKTGDLSKIGKRHENKDFEFEIENKDDLSSACSDAMFYQGMDGWVSDNYYSSQKSFFIKDGKQYARTTIRRWVDKTVTPQP